MCQMRKSTVYYPSDYFYSQLFLMKELFKSINGEKLCDGKDCLMTLISQLKSVDRITLPDEIMHFFAKISIYFRIRYLNKNNSLSRKGRTALSDR